MYPPRCLLVVAGLPGAGKSTLLRRLYALTGNEREPVRTAGGALVLDSEQARDRWQARLGHIPYRYWRPLVHLTHYLRLWRLVDHEGPVVLHECGTRPRLFLAVVRLAARHRREVHVILLDVPASLARQSARARSRLLHLAGFERHAARWTRLRVLLEQRPDRALLGGRSITMLDRAGVNNLSIVEFRGTPDPTGAVVVNAPHRHRGRPDRPASSGRPAGRIHDAGDPAMHMQTRIVKRIIDEQRGTVVASGRRVAGRPGGNGTDPAAKLALFGVGVVVWRAPTSRTRSGAATGSATHPTLDSDRDRCRE